MKIKNVTKELVFYVELDEDVDDPEFLWYRKNDTYQTWEVLINESWEKCTNNLELNEALREYYKKNLSPARDIMII
jgi:hypothetical protein